MSDEQMVETVPLIDHRLDDGPGPGPLLTACSFDHAIELCAALGPAKVGQPEQRKARVGDRPLWCTACAWCGALVVRPEQCVLHDECPKVDLERTVLLGDAADFIATIMKSKGFQPMVPDSQWDALVEEAATRPVFYQSRGGTFLAAVILRRFGVFRSLEDFEGDVDEDPF